jgi:ComF family protein
VILDFLFPKNCVNCGAEGKYLCDQCQKKLVYLNNQVCPGCKALTKTGETHPECVKKTNLDGLTAVYDYNRAIKQVVHAYKYQFIEDLKLLLSKLIYQYLNSKEWFKDLIKKEFVITAVPLHKKRRSWRGFNQSGLIGQELSKKLNLQYQRLLKRINNTDPQVDLTGKERIKNVKNAFQTLAEVSTKRIILFDDVYTTGATLEACAGELKKQGAEGVWGLTLCRSSRNKAV